MLKAFLHQLMRLIVVELLYWISGGDFGNAVYVLLLRRWIWYYGYYLLVL